MSAFRQIEMSPLVYVRPVFWFSKRTREPAMFRIPRVSISMRELDRLKCIQGLIDKQDRQESS